VDWRLATANFSIGCFWCWYWASAEFEPFRIIASDPAYNVDRKHFSGFSGNARDRKMVRILAIIKSLSVWTGMPGRQRDLTVAMPWIYERSYHGKDRKLKP
jgi:hypothetical protein